MSDLFSNSAFIYFCGLGSPKKRKIFFLLFPLLPFSFLLSCFWVLTPLVIHMGFFQNLFQPNHKDAKVLNNSNINTNNNHRSTAKDKATSKRQNNNTSPVHNALPVPNSIPLPPLPQQQQQQQSQQQPQQDQTSNQSPPSSLTTTRSHPLPTTNNSTGHRRFQLNEDGSHTHHLTMPAPSRFTGLVDGLLQLDKSIRRGWGGDKKQAAHTSPDGQPSLAPALVEERAAIDATLQRMPSTSSFAQKWGDCQEIIGRGAFGVVRVAHKKDSPDSKERLYAVKV
jgi:protein-serine/threonine kinase